MKPQHLSLIIVSFAALPCRADAPDWKLDRVDDGIKVEAREVPGSSFAELKLTTDSALPLAALCDAVWAKDLGSKADGAFKKRVVIREDEHERWTYEQIRAPVVSDRDYVMKVTLLTPASSGRCEIAFETAADPSYPPTRDHVRLNKVRGHWWLEPGDGGKVRVTYQLFSDPGGSVPAFLAKGGQRSAAIDFLKTILARARKAETASK